MRKADLVNKIADKTGISKVDVLVTLETMFKEIKDSMAEGNNLYIRGFGSFSLHHRPPRVGRNPKTGESVSVGSKYVPHFKPGKELKERVNQSIQEDK